jgi:hypothetical protein
MQRTTRGHEQTGQAAGIAAGKSATFARAASAVAQDAFDLSSCGHDQPRSLGRINRDVVLTQSTGRLRTYEADSSKVPRRQILLHSPKPRGPHSAVPTTATAYFLPLSPPSPPPSPPDSLYSSAARYAMSKRKRPPSMGSTIWGD